MMLIKQHHKSKFTKFNIKPIKLPYSLKNLVFLFHTSMQKYCKIASPSVWSHLQEFLQNAFNDSRIGNFVNFRTDIFLNPTSIRSTYSKNTN